VARAPGTFDHVAWRPGAGQREGEIAAVFADRRPVGEALRFLELSIRTDPPEELALAEQRDFQRRIGAEGFDPDAVQEPKTKKVLEYFATVVR
jgi:hypothetical protein